MNPMKLCAAALGALCLHSGAATCAATAGAPVPRVVELYTSEGCNSCPPADRWLSTLKTEPDVVALAFHVDYWDRLGWKDRFASAAFTRRQAEQQAFNGARFSYTPQVVVNGADRRAGTLPPPAATDVSLSLERDGERYVATVRHGAARSLAAYWAVTENGHSSAVKAGENEGVTLKHDFVVREFVPVAAWSAAAGDAKTLDFRPGIAADAAHPREVKLVVVDAATGKPVQARKLGC
jgi:hypothetical protein